ncbi:hypothetical protein [Leptospira kmetyi]|uniref:hypothetical protein n=1 Tax=Leptospira kmetyi TaxID=408139 RepID=UPI001082EF4E|nr:hypothetical protein [Leptospira kmetyi]TGL69372.1 hypothetical protein EHQ67_08955 [Leptospira kmetyi]
MNRRDYKIDELRELLLSSSDGLFKNNINSKLSLAIRSKFPNISRAFVTNWICEQGEDIYTIVVGIDLIMQIEISRVNESEEPIVEIFSASQYKNKYPYLTKISKRTLTLALALMEDAR